MSGTSSLGSPRWRALANGTVLAGLEAGEVHTNNYARGDTFDLSFAFSTAPTWFDPVGTGQIDLTVQGTLAGASTQSAAWTTLIQGRADNANWDPFGLRLSLSGRDYSSKLIDMRVDLDAYLNKTSSEVAAALAAAAGLTINATSTSTYVGQYFQIEHKRHGLATHSHQTTAWDLLSRLARIEGYDLWLSGTTLNFQPQLADTTPAFALPLSVATGSNGGAERATLNRLFGHTAGLLVEVHSWSSRQRRSYVGRWPPSGSTGSGAGASTQRIAVVRPNLLQAQCDLEAKRLFDAHMAHQRTVTVSMPAELTLSPRQRVAVSRTCTTWDATYRIDSITRRWSTREFSQSLVLRNRDDLAQEDGSI